MQERSLLVTDTAIFKLDPHKQYQRKKSPLDLSQVIGLSLSPANDQGFVVHFRNMKDLLCYMINPHHENRVAELVAVLYQICQRSGLGERLGGVEAAYLTVYPSICGCDHINAFVMRVEGEFHLI